MATLNTYTGNGSQTLYSITFEYLDETDVNVRINGSETSAYTFANATTIQFDTAPANGDDILIYRSTDVSEPIVTFFAGSAIRAQDLNKANDQIRFSVEEWRGQTVPLYDAVLPDDINMGGHQINNMGEPTSSHDAATKNYVDTTTWNVTTETLQVGETWVSDDTVIATAGAIDDRIDDKIDIAITNDIGTDGTGITVTDDGDGTITLGLAANSIDFDRLKNVDIITEAEQTAQSPSWGDSYISTAAAIANRHDLVVSNSAPTTTQIGKLWFNNTTNVNSLNMWDGSNWKVVTSGTPYIPQGTTIVRYVDSVNGSDAIDVTGFLPQAPLQSIKRALTLTNASATGDGTLILVAPGVYQETLPLRIQKNNVSIVGTSLRSCFVHPTVATETNNMFEVDSGSYIANLTLLGLKVPVANQGSRNNPLDNDATYGLPNNQPFAVRFRTDTPAVIIKSPYIQNCTNFCDAHFDNANFDPNTFPATDAQTYSAVAGDQSSAPTGGGLLIDGSAVSSSSPLRSMVVDSFTQICLDGPGVLVTNNGYAQLVSFFGTFTHYHAKAKNGGQINLSNCVTDFGRYGLIADGKSPSSIASATITSPSAGAGNGSTTVTIGAITTNPSFHGTVVRPLNHMMITIDGVDYGVVSSVANGGGWDVTLSSPLTSNISSATANFALRSYISTGGHTFEFVGVGTNYSDLPDNGGVPIEANQVIELNGGKVWQSSTDQVGKFKAGST
ncbi:MAG: phage tail fiber protein, partial [Candidatus Nanopelagicaceae bacterium]